MGQSLTFGLGGPGCEASPTRTPRMPTSTPSYKSVTHFTNHGRTIFCSPRFQLGASICNQLTSPTLKRLGLSRSTSPPADLSADRSTTAPDLRHWLGCSLLGNVFCWVPNLASVCPSPPLAGPLSSTLLGARPPSAAIGGLSIGGGTTTVCFDTRQPGLCLLELCNFRHPFLVQLRDATAGTLDERFAFLDLHCKRRFATGHLSSFQKQP